MQFFMECDIYKTDSRLFSTYGSAGYLMVFSSSAKKQLLWKTNILFVKFYFSIS